MDTSVKNKQVGDAEQAVLTVEDRIHARHSGLPFYILPTRMMTEIVAFTVIWLNSFPTAGGVFDTYSQQNIVVGNQLDYTKHCRPPFRAYAQVHNDPLNSTALPHSTPDICLDPTENAGGSYKILNLDTGRVIKCYQFKEHAITPAIEHCIAKLAAKNDQDAKLTFRNRAGEHHW